VQYAILSVIHVRISVLHDLSIAYSNRSWTNGSTCNVCICVHYVVGCSVRTECNYEEQGEEVMIYYDDNFGHWDDMDEEENRAFYQHVQRTNVRKKCQGCGKMVMIQPSYSYCNSCADKRERGYDI